MDYRVVSDSESPPRREVAAIPIGINAADDSPPDRDGSPGARSGSGSSGEPSPPHKVADDATPLLLGAHGGPKKFSTVVALSVASETGTVSNDKNDDDGDDGGGEDEAHPDAAVHLDAPPMRSAIFTMLPLFSGYASLVTLQDDLKAHLGIGDNGTPGSYEFSFAVSLLYFGNLAFRLLHNILFAPLRPRYRVVVSYACMITALLTLSIAYYFANSSNLAWVYVAYIVGGIGVGTFESNLISTITPLGHATKSWAQYGISIGFGGVSVGCFILFAIWPSRPWLQCGVYLFIAFMNLSGMVFFLKMIPDVTFSSTNKTLPVFIADMKRVREWMPKIWQHSVALCIDMFAVGLVSALQLYIYDVSSIPLWLRDYPRSNAASVAGVPTIPKNVFRALFNGCSLVGDASGRRVAYWVKGHVHPFWFLILTAIGTAMILSKTALIAPLGMLCVMFANGSIYAHTTKYIDDKVAHRFNLITLSGWLLCGDAGSVAGSNVVAPLRVLIGGV